MLYSSGLPLRPWICPLRPEICPPQALNLSPQASNQTLGQNRPQKRRSPKGGWMDKKTDRRMEGQIDSPCVLPDFVPFRAAAPQLLPPSLNHRQPKQGTGTADNLLPLGCYHFFCSYPNEQVTSPSLPLPFRTRLGYPTYHVIATNQNTNLGFWPMSTFLLQKCRGSIINS